MDGEANESSRLFTSMDGNVISTGETVAIVSDLSPLYPVPGCAQQVGGGRTSAFRNGLYLRFRFTVDQKSNVRLRND